MAQKDMNMMSEVSPKKRRILMPVLVLVFIILIGLIGYLFWQNMQLKKSPQAVAQQEVKSLVDKVSKLIVLPVGETPTIATVSEPEKLKDQAFFSNAQKGDKVLIYTNAKKAILYSPVTNKIVDVAPINIGNTTPATPAPKVTTPTTEKKP